MDEIIIRRPDDFHSHPREGKILKAVLPYHNIFGRVVVMGNLRRLIETARDVTKYKKEIEQYNPRFEPIMTAMLTNRTTPRILRKAYKAGARALKVIPGQASTNANTEVDLTYLKQYYFVLEEAQRLNMIVPIHCELIIDPKTGKEIPEFFREIMAMPYLMRLVDDFPDLKIVVEHVSTMEMIELVKRLPPNVAATITAHHLFLSCFDVKSKGKINNPLNYCKPIAKLPGDQQYLIKTAISGNPKFFFGSDSAPHLLSAKMANPPAAGIFTVPVAIPLLAQAFDENNALDKLDNFASGYGPLHYGLPLNQDTITIRRQSWPVPRQHQGIPIFKGGEILNWQVVQ